MTTIIFLAPFKTYQPGDVARLETNQAEWLISRRYADPALDLPRVEQREPQPLNRDPQPLKKGKKK
jgi:hypothetical protein